jgi:Macrophage migration inhibitory factor (MIF)
MLTSLQIETEQIFLSDISFQLSEIYQRPESCIVVLVLPCQAMLFGGSPEPAYYMTITALASEIAPTKNKRSTALVQGFMHESLDIAPRRGIIRFEPIAEENLATNGITVLQEIEDMERNSSEESRALRSLSRNRSRKSKRAYTPAFMDRGKTPTPHVARHDKFSSGENDGCRSDLSSTDKKRMKRRKSFMAFFGR